MISQPLSHKPISRRVFLKASGGVLAGTLAFASGPIALLAPSRSWAVPLEHLSSRQGEVLLAVTRQLFPHADLEDAVYALVIKSLDKKAADGEVSEQLSTGVTQLDDKAGGDWLTLDDAQRLALLKEMTKAPFFELVRGDAVVSLYNNPLAFAHFGYEGEKGNSGYLTRGFNDLTWLPDPAQPDAGYLPSEEPST
ncbi:twin-arginine translocation signal domain-containing protein [Halomonas binhaiensis]|uniref:Twin-arginine translocation signal domain-containing protein n=1 Tax=Halomonas binhaiensis TaxID=2562282 RepID=A0A5C1NHZ6_9GAMM|nr:twin-arginine translocation signal domain-containing protein [Halomonas binhaiensis]QEM82391.1 twin-arginine translocation signal domain-containing protein [Halomonas binhaiensis]